MKYLNSKKRTKAGLHKRILIALLIVVMMQTATPSINTVFAKDNMQAEGSSLKAEGNSIQSESVTFVEGEAFPINIDTDGEELMLKVPDGLSLKSKDIEKADDDTLILKGKLELSFTAVAGKYTLQLNNKEGEKVGNPIKIEVKSKASGINADINIKDDESNKDDTKKNDEKSNKDGGIEISKPDTEIPNLGAKVKPFGIGDPLAVFDGLDLAGTADSKTYGHEHFAGTAKLLTVDANFTQDSLNRTITIKIEKGLSFNTLPGFSWNASNRTWEYDNSRLPTEQQSAVTNATFTPDILTEAHGYSSGNYRYNLRSGTVTYYINSSNVTELVLSPTVRYDEELMMGAEDKVFTDFITVTTNEDGNIIETQKLETLNVTGQAGINPYCAPVTVATAAPGQSLVQSDYELRMRKAGYGGSGQTTANGTIFYIPHAEFTVNVPEGLVVDSTNPLGWAAGSIFDNAGAISVASITTVTVSTARPNALAGSTDVRIVVDKVLIHGAEYGRFWLNMSVDPLMPEGSYTLRSSEFSASSYVGGGSPGSVGSYSGNHPVVLIKINDGLVTLETLKFNVPYVTEDMITMGKGSYLGNYQLHNDNPVHPVSPVPLPLQTIRIDFANSDVVHPRIVSIPVGDTELGTIGSGVYGAPHVKAYLSSGDTVEVTNLTKGFADNPGSKVVIFSLEDYPEWTGSNYITAIEYEIENLPAEYGREVGANNTNAGPLSGFYGAFDGTKTRPTNVEFTVKLIKNSIANINGNWTSPASEILMECPVEDPGVTFSVSGITNGQTYKAGESTTITSTIQVGGQYLYSTPTNPKKHAAITYMKGMDVYVRGMGSMTIDPNSFTTAVRTAGKGFRAPTDATAVPVSSSNVTLMQDNTGNPVYKVHLPDAVLARGAYDSERPGGKNLGIVLKYTASVKKDIQTQLHPQSDLLWIRPLYNTDDTTHYYSPRPWSDVSSLLQNTQNIYDVAGDGTTSWYYGTHQSANSFLLQAQNSFMAATDAQLVVGGSESGFKTAETEADALTLTPFGTIEYRFRALNNSGKAVGNYTTHIPLPTAGEGAGSNFFSDEAKTVPAKFEWTARLTGPVQLPSGVNATVQYSISYQADTTTDIGFEAWNAANAADYRTVRIVYSSPPMADGAEHAYILPMQAASGTSGDVNFYRSSISYQLTGSTAQTNLTSEPVAIKLASGIVVGRVFQDNDRNGSFTTGSALTADDVPLANVSVTPTITSGPSFDANGGVPVILNPVFTNADGYYQIVLDVGDVVSVEINNQGYNSKMLRFPADTSVQQTKTYTGIAANSTNPTNDSELQGGLVGMIPPYKISWNDNRTSGATVFDSIYRYGNEPISGTHEVPDTLATVPPTASTITGYALEKWYSNDTGTGGIEPSDWTGTYGDTIFYALRAPKSLTITFDKNATDASNGTVTSIIDKEYDGTIGSDFPTASPQIPTRGIGYSFLGWSTDSGSSNAVNFYATTPLTTANGVNATPTPATLTLYAVWRTIPTANVRYEITGVDIPANYSGMPTSPQLKEVGDTVTVAPDMMTTESTNNGIPGTWFFNGWTSTDVTIPNGAGDDFPMPSSDVTITGSWTFTANNQYNVTYSVTGDTPANVNNMPSATQSRYEAQRVAVAASPTTTSTTNASGVPGTWKFNGWKSGDVSIPNGAGASFIMPGKNVAITGTWTFTEAPKYKVIYNANGGKNPPTDNNKYYSGTTVTTLGKSKMARSGYNFEGWNTKTNGKGKSYEPGSTFKITGKITLYAVWVKVSKRPSSPTPVTPPTPPSTPPVPVTPVTPTPVTPTPVTPTDEEPVDESDDNQDNDSSVIAQTSPSDEQGGGGGTSDSSPQQEAITQGSSMPPAEVLEEIKASNIPVISIGGTEVPLYAGSAMNKHVWALLNLIFALIGLILAIITIIRASGRKRKDEGEEEYYQSNSYYDEEGNETSVKKKRILWILIAIITGVLGICVFFLTENMKNLMVLTDNWTIVNGIILLLGIIGYAFSFKREKEEKITLA